MKTDLESMLQVVNAQYMNILMKMHAVRQEETALRSKLAKLDQMTKKASVDAAHSRAMKQIGADLLWKAWRDETQRHLNQELAKVMARKLPFQGKLQLSFGRKNALQHMILNEKKAQKRRADKAFEERLVGKV